MNSRASEDNMKIFLFLLAASVGFSLHTAFAQSPGTHVTRSIHGLVNKVITIEKNACRGPQMDDSFAGLPGNLSDDIRCQSIIVAASACQNLAGQAGIFLDMVNNGSMTFATIKHSVDNSTGSGVGNAFSALVLAQQAPAGTDASRLVNEVFRSCTAVIK